MDHKYNMLLYEFRTVAKELADFEHSEEMQYLKGWIVCKTWEGKPYYYLRKADYVDKKPVCAAKYCDHAWGEGAVERGVHCGECGICTRHSVLL